MRRLAVLAIVIGFVLLCGVVVSAQETPPEPPPPPAPAATAPDILAAPVVREVKIVIDNKAKSNGEIRFTFTPAGGPSKEIRVSVLSGMSKKDICRDVAKELTLAVGPNYTIDHYDDDKVKVEGKADATFSLTLAGQTVSGISITLK